MCGDWGRRTAMRGNGRLRLAPHGPGPVAIPDAILTEASTAGQLAQNFVRPVPAPDFDGEYGFLTTASVSSPALMLAEAEAARLGVAPHEVLLSIGAIASDAYAAALAKRLGTLHADWSAIFDVGRIDHPHDAAALGLQARVGTVSCRALCAEDGTPDMVRARVERLQ